MNTKRKIAKYRDERVPGYWLVTDFTMNQIERAFENYENRIQQLCTENKNLKREGNEKTDT
jgi:Uma2 family endonuclease